MGEKIRQFFRDLLGSRYVAHLEEEVLRVREDCELRLRDKDGVIAGLRTEKALLQSKIINLENAVLPYMSRAGNEVVSGRTGSPKLKPNFDIMGSLPPVETSWQRQVREHNEKNARELAEEREAEASKG